MLTSFSSNAILAKARAMYGKHLKKEDYTALLDCHSVLDVATYLKNQTLYSGVLSGINISGIHRGELETYLRQKLFEDYATLCRYELSVGEHFSNYLVASSEIEQILHSILLLAAGHSEDYLFYMPSYLTRHTKIDLVALTHLKTYDDLLDALSRTPYHELIEPFKPLDNSPLDYASIENTLYIYLYQNVFKIIEEYTHGENKKQLQDLFFSYADLNNTIRIIRLKQSYGERVDDIRSLLLPYGKLSNRIVQNMLEADSGEVMDILAKTSVGRRSKNVEYSYLDQMPLRARYMLCKHDIRFSTHPSVVMISYIFLSQTELMDITNILEGIRYQMAPSEIKNLLTAIDH